MNEALANKFIADVAIALKRTSYYATREGVIVLAERPADLKKRLGEIDDGDFRKLGFAVVEAQYIGGAHPTGRYCTVVVGHVCNFRLVKAADGWLLEGTEFLDGYYDSTWAALHAVNEVNHG